MWQKLEGFQENIVLDCSIGILSDFLIAKKININIHRVIGADLYRIHQRGQGATGDWEWEGLGGHHQGY